MICLFLYLCAGFFLAGLYSGAYKTDGYTESIIIGFGWIFLIPFMVGHSITKKKKADPSDAN